MNRRNKPMRMGIGPDDGHRASPAEPDSAIMNFGELEQLVIEDAIRVAWARIPAEAHRRGINLNTTNETPINRLLQAELDKLRRDEAQPVPGFHESNFQHIPESEGTPDHTGTLSDENTKRPDLVVRPVIVPKGISSMEYGLFIECKIVGTSTDQHRMYDYCSDGLIKFIDGRYASRMSNGMMVAYVRNQKSISDDLTPYLNERKTKYEVVSLPAPRNGETSRIPPVYVSKHSRSNIAELKLGDIEIAHLWLQVA